MSLANRLTDLATAIGADIKSLRAIKGSSRIWVIPFDFTNIFGNSSNSYDNATAANRTPARGFRDTFRDEVAFHVDIPTDWLTWSVDLHYATAPSAGDVMLSATKSPMAVDAAPYASVVSVNNTMAVANSGSTPTLKVLSNMFNAVAGTGLHRFTFQRDATLAGDTLAEAFYVYGMLLRKVT